MKKKHGKKEKKNVCAIASVHGCGWLVLGKGKKKKTTKLGENNMKIKYKNSENIKSHSVHGSSVHAVKTFKSPQ